MPNELKIVIDADVNKAIAGVQNLSKVIAADFTKATNLATAAATNLSSEVAASVQKINSSLASLKITSLDVSVNTSGIDANIKSIQSKFAALVDPQINVLANTELAEAKIKDLLADLSTIKGSEIFIRANDTQALKVINEVEAELNSLVGKQIKINIDAANALERIGVLEKELLSLESLKVSPEISVTQLGVFEKNIQRIKTEIASLKVEGVVIPITVPPIPPNVIRSINELQQELDELKAKINFSTDINEIARLGDEFRRVEAQISNIKVAGNLSGQFDKLGLAGKRAADGLKLIPKASNSATTSLINLGRVVQDAPFGIIGVANNINPLLESFQRLRAESRSTGAAFKAFGAALIGGGGIGLGVSVITSLLTQFALSNRGATEESNKFTKAVEANADAVRRKEDELKSALDKASASLLSQTDKLKDLNKILVSTAASIDEITAATIRQGVAQFVFDKKNVELQKLLNAEIQKELRLRKQTDIRTTVPEFDPGIISTDPLQRQAADARQTLGTLNFLGAGLESFFKKFASGGKDASKEFDKFVDETISKARQFAKEFGDSFIVPNLDDSFFKTKAELFEQSKNLLADVKRFLSGDQTALKIKIPVLATTETRLDDSDLKKFLRDEITRDQIKETKIKIPLVTDFDIQIAESLPKQFEEFQNKFIDGFFSGIRIERSIPIELTPDITLSKLNLDLVDKKLDLKKQFSVLGKIGDKEFLKIDFTNLNKGINEASKRLQGMMEVANTLNQAIGQGLVNAFNSMFDAVLEGKSVFKALGEAIKQLVVGTIKAIAQMLILRLVTNAIFPGAGGAIPIPRLGGISGGTANPGNFGGAIGGSAFSNVIQIVGRTEVSGSNLVTVFSRANTSLGRTE